MPANLNRLLNRFPARHLVHCFAYGSGVFRQAGRTAADPPAMVDLMFVVDDPAGFHRENLAANSGHYSAVRRLGAAAVSRLQTTGFGAGVYFNTNVTVDRVTFKYGVIDAEDFGRDLRTWRTLYVAGRLHKPVVTLLDGGAGVAGLIERNLRSAVHAALLQLPAAFPETDLYAAIAGLSYRGDFRMIVGEDRNKVANIVRPQVAEFRSLYAPVLDAMADRVTVRGSSVAQDTGAECKLYHLRRLPRCLKDALIGRRSDEDGALRRLSERDDVDRSVRNGIYRIVFYPSLTQSVKGILTAGLLKSVVYSYNKLNKMVKSLLV